MQGERKHLWEADHAYYCNLGNYYANDCGARYKTWDAFLSEEGGADLDMNLVFRFDWYEGEDHGASAFNGDRYYRNGLLHVFFMGQRKGAYRFASVEVCRADEPAVLEYLAPRWEHMRALWAPLSEAIQP